MNNRMDRTKLQIGTYYLREFARTEAHIRDAAACGIDFFICTSTDTDMLDLFHRYGLGAVACGVVPRWFGGDGSKAGGYDAQFPREMFTNGAASFTDHPAIWGMDLVDEPSSLDFPGIADRFVLTQNLFPNQFPYVNLYPNYASVAENTDAQKVNQLGTPSYAEYIDRYCAEVPADYISYDYYCYAAGIPRAYENLRIVSEACRRTGRQMWIILQVNSRNPEKWISADNLRFQAFTSMAFGAEVISWACYTSGWWHNQVLDNQGEKTQQYDKLKTVNAELHLIGTEYMKYRNTSAHMIGFDGTEWLSVYNGTSADALDTGVFHGVREASGKPLIIGQMSARNGDGSTALMIADASDPYGTDSTPRDICFRAEGKFVRALGGNGYIPLQQDEDGVYHVSLAPSAGVLITAR